MAEGVSKAMEEMVVEALLFGDRQAQLLAARQLAQFSSKQRHKIAEKGVVPPLILMMSTFDDCEVIEAALFALLSIAFRSERLARVYFIQGRPNMLTNRSVIDTCLIFQN